jgi:hypothetical protein
VGAVIATFFVALAILAAVTNIVLGFVQARGGRPIVIGQLLRMPWRAYGARENLKREGRAEAVNGVGALFLCTGMVAPGPQPVVSLLATMVAMLLFFMSYQVRSSVAGRG